MEKQKVLFEPLPLFGVESIIYSKEQALKILKSNSYYLFVAGFIALFGYLATEVYSLDIGTREIYILIFALFLFAIGTLIRWRQSRVASIVSFLIFLYALFANFYVAGFGGIYIISVILLAASYRCIKASFYYHKDTL
jgi:prepilin signal peptidase PulO-like enzyme (type II secretory pathway)